MFLTLGFRIYLNNEKNRLKFQIFRHPWPFVLLHQLTYTFVSLDIYILIVQRA